MRCVILLLALLLPVGALAQAPSDAEKCSNASGSADETVSACTRAIESKRYTGTDLAILLNSRAISWREKGFDDMALVDFDEAIRLAPKSATPYISRGNVHNDKGDYDKAIADYSAALKLDPKLAPAYSNRGVSWMAKGVNDRALADFNRAIQLEPKSPNAYNNRGYFWNAKGDARRAIADFDLVIKLDPKFADAHDSLALIFATSADPKVRNGKRAVELAQKACELSGFGNPYYLNTLAAAQAEAGNFKAAADTQSKALAMKAFSPAGQESAAARLKLYQAGRPFHETPRGAAK